MGTNWNGRKTKRFGHVDCKPPTRKRKTPCWFKRLFPCFRKSY
jgi:hypothetical protein